jgi:glycosyltransferase involved in cell wall biosynthesis
MSSDRKHGISVLLASQNSERTIEPCVRSFVEFADEIVCVDNGSNDRTIEILRQLESEIPKLTVHDAPELQHLYENRQYAFERSHYNWVCRFDTDYVAYTDGPHDARKLRAQILATPRGPWPIAFEILQPVVCYDYFRAGTMKRDRPGKGPHVHEPVEYLPARILQTYRNMKFVRLGRWEGLTYQRFLRRVRLQNPYWMHCELKTTDLDFLLRSERTNWRERGDFETFPTLQSYLESVIQQKYDTNDLELAAQRYLERDMFPYLVKYEPERYYPYPELVLEQIKLTKQTSP